MSNASQEKISLSTDQFESMMARLLAEARKPAELTEEQQEEQDRKKQAREQDKELRRQQAQLELERIANRKIEQSMCSHKHKNQNTCTVHVQNGNYLLCLHCQAVIRPTGAVGGDSDIFDTNLFNMHFQMGQNATSF
jgi:hypothetical protein